MAIGHYFATRLYQLNNVPSGDVLMKALLLLLISGLSFATFGDQTKPDVSTSDPSLEKLVEERPKLEIPEEEIQTIQNNKAIAFEVWKKSQSSDRPVGANTFLEYLQRVNNKLPIPPELMIGKALIDKLKELPTLPAIGYFPGNGRPLFEMLGYRFYNEYADTYYNGPDPAERSTMDLQSAKCKGYLTLQNTEAARKNIANCFVSKDFRIEVLAGKHAEYNYLGAIKLVTSIVDKRDRHLCMASFYRENTWITAKHCLVKSNIKFGIYLVLPSGPKLIKPTDITTCSKEKCDVSLITADTSHIHADGWFDSSPDLKKLKPDSIIFLPGIVQGTPVSKSIHRQDYEETLMWSDVGKGYCRIRNIYTGCMSHTCSTIDGWSGGPVYGYDNRRVSLLGVHSGYSSEEVTCAGRGDNMPTNYATLKPLYEGM